MNKDLISCYNDYENKLIVDFNRHVFYKKFKGFSKKEFINYLLQLGYISAEFVKFIERAKLPLKSDIGREAVRNILRDEIPQSGPTHQDNRFYDLKKIGLSENEILNYPASNSTKNYINDIYSLVKWPQDNYDLRVLITLRVLGEVLVGETYRKVVEGLKRHFNLRPEESLFYTFHWEHDQKGGKGDEGGIGHTEYYDIVLKELIVDQKTLNIAKEAAKTAYNVRCKFHEQFI